MDTEIREIVYTAISALVLSIVLGFVSLMGIVQGDIAKSRNDEIAGNQAMLQYREYNKYDKAQLCGEDVIECIRMHYDQGITIYVVSDDITFHEYNMLTYTANGGSNKQYFSIDGPYMSEWFSHDKSYRSYLVYNGEAPLDKYTRMWNKYNPIIGDTMIQRCDKLDKTLVNSTVNSVVTGVIIIDLKKIMPEGE